MLKELKAKRVALGISQKDLADRLGITSIWLGYIENKQKSSPKLEMKIKEALSEIEREKREMLDIPSPS